MELVKTKYQLEQADLIFKLAFINYPLYTYLFPDETQRQKVLPILFEISALYFSEFCYCVSNKNTIEAVLLMDSPTAKPPSFFSYLKLVSKYWNKLPIGKILKMISIFSEIQKAQPKQNFYYIQTIAVHPEFQGKGLGKKVISFAKNLAKDQPIYLETNSKDNVKYYEKLGFTFYKNFKCDKGKGPDTWSFLWKSIEPKLF